MGAPGIATELVPLDCVGLGPIGPPLWPSSATVARHAVVAASSGANAHARRGLERC